MKFSIVTPIYNSYHLMDRFFYSLENQTFKDFELILIDDSSTDYSLDKIKDYINRSRLDIKVYKTKTNLGPGSARNVGIKKSSGEWITFIDNDDWVDINWLSDISIVIESNDIDCVIYDYYIANESNVKKTRRSLVSSNEGIVDKNICVMNVSNHTIGKFYKRQNLIKYNVVFPETRRCEDVAFTTLAINSCSYIYYHKKPYYFYFQRRNSLSNNTSMDERDMIKAFLILEDKLGGIYPNEIMEKSIKDLLYGGVLIIAKAGKKNSYIRNYINEYEQKYPRWFSSKSIKLLPLYKRFFLFFIRFKWITSIKILSWIHTKMIE